MNKLGTVIILLFFFLYSGCSSDDKGKKILGKWKTVNNRNNSQIEMMITDSTILTEFWFDEGIKKVQYKYSISEETDSSLIIESMNYFNIVTFDTIYFDSSRISFSTQDGDHFLMYKLD